VTTLAPAVSVIVGTIERWPVVRPCLDRLLPQVASAGGELLLADGTADGSGAEPGPSGHRAGVTVLHLPGASIFALRAKAARLARAPILAFTEDHCLVSPTWVADLLRAHAAHPEADMVAGPVTNGSSDGLADWANFLMTFAEFMPPPPARALRRTPPMGNASFQRRVLLGGELPEGWLEVVLAPTLVHGRRLHYDEAIRVSHVQPRTLRVAMAAHFNNGRACAGLARPHMARRDWWTRLATVPVQPGVLFTSVLRSIGRRPIPVRARASLPMMSLLCLAHSSGELAGLLFGEGRSAKKLN
jgi:hypothetical protein